MHINPSLTGPQNIIAYATNPAFTAPTDPNNVLCGTPLPFPPPNGFTEIPGVNIDGSNSNTMVDVYITDLLEDVNEDGATQTIIYERGLISAGVASNPGVTVTTQTQGALLLEAIALQLGLVATELQLISTATGTAVIGPITNSVLYLPGNLTVTLVYSD
jgi:hypothetical protein